MLQWADTQAQFACALLDPGRSPPGGVLGTTDRFAIYRNNVVVSLLDALQDRFPVTCAIVGEEFFRAMSRLFLQQHPPRSRVMMFYGDELPAFIASFEPASAVPYLADVARLESAWTHAYHAADTQALQVSVLQSMNATQLASSTVRLHPSVHLIRSSYSIATIWAAHQSCESPAVAAESAEDVLIVRPGSEVVVHRLPPGGLTFVEALWHGRTIEQALNLALDASTQLDAGVHLLGLLSMGAVTAIDAKEQEPQ